MTAQDLKNSILQLAVQGKLVPQDPSDEPASELLKRIQAEKAKLIKDGKIKKEKPLPAIADEEIPFDIPKSWKWVRLGNIGTWGSGATPNKSNVDFYNDATIPWLVTGDLNDGIITEIPGKITELALGKTSVKLNPTNSVLIAMYGATIGKVGLLSFPATTNQACCACQVCEGVYEWYLLYYLMSQRKAFIKRGEGGAQPNISKEKIVVTLMPLPPLDEQKRIVAKIEELMPLVEEYGKTEERIKALNADFPDKLRKSILQQAVQGKLTERDPSDELASELLKRIRTEKAKLIAEGKIKKEKPLPAITDEEKPFDIPDTWEWVRLGDLGETQTGTTPSTKNPAFFGTDIPFIKPADIHSDHINYENEGLSFLGCEQGRKIFCNSVMMVCIGGSIGKTYFNDRDVCCNQQINTITPIFCEVKYVWLAMSSNYFYEKLQEKATGTATPIINKNLWSNIVIPLPPLAEQKRIVARVEKLLAACDGLK